MDLFGPAYYLFVILFSIIVIGVVTCIGFKKDNDNKAIEENKIIQKSCIQLNGKIYCELK